jgi:CRP/FNR family cyclic AMP-dependent transcriptional regulator
MTRDEPPAKLVWLLSPADLAVLEQLGRPHRYRANDVLFTQDEPSYHAVLILEGQVKVTSDGPDGREILLARRGPQAIVGEFSAIDHRRRSARVTATEPVRAVVVRSKQLNEFLLEHPYAMHSLLVALIGCLRGTDVQVEIGTRSVPCRVVRHLVELAEHEGDRARERDIELRITQDELAGWIGASRTATNRALAKLGNAEVITTGRRDPRSRSPTATRSAGVPLGLSVHNGTALCIPRCGDRLAVHPW